MIKKKLVAVASGGGHWKQLMLISPAFEEFDTHYITTICGLPENSGIKNFSIVQDSNKSNKINIILTFYQIFKILLKEKPDIIISTGAAPGILSVAIGRLIGAKTIWIRGEFT